MFRSHLNIIKVIIIQLEIIICDFHYWKQDVHFPMYMQLRLPHPICHLRIGLHTSRDVTKILLKLCPHIILHRDCQTSK